MSVSSDNVLTATADNTRQAVTLSVDFSASTGTVPPAGTVNLNGLPNNENSASWVAGASSTVTQSSTLAHLGTFSSRLTRSTTSGSAIAVLAGIVILPSTAHTYSVYVRSAVARSFTLSVQHKTLAGATSGSATTSSGVTSSTSAWTRLTVTATSPSNANIADLTVTVASVASTSEFHYLDSSQAERGSTATAYCDGNQAGCAWTGAANASVSYRPAYDRLTIRRSTGMVIRGLDNVSAPGGRHTKGYDNEAPRGVAITYQATISNGLASITSTTASVTVTSDGNAWLSHLTKPALSMPVTVRELPTWENGVEESVSSELGGYWYLVTQGSRNADTGTLEVMTRSSTERAALTALLLAGGPFLLQCPATWDEPDRYFTVGAVPRRRLVRTGADLYRVFELPLTEVARPSTTGSSVAYPGHTYADSAAATALYSGVSGTYGAA